MTTSVNIVAVVVIYEEQLMDTKTYQSFLGQGNIPFLVYDNSKQAQPVDLKEKSRYIHDSSNGGVSKAYNRAIQWAQEISATHLLLLDSDSSFPENALKVYQEEVLKNENFIILPELISSERKISPFYFNNGKARYGEGIEVGAIKLGKILAINSASLLPLSILSEEKVFNEKLPLDWSDIYFFRKMGKQGVKAAHISLKVRHKLSDHELKTIESSQYRFKLLRKGIPEVSDNTSEKIQMYWWLLLKTVKLSWQYRSFWFINHYFSFRK